MIEMYLLQQLEAVARTGTMVAASEELHLTQPTLTRSMQKLEQELGVPLFDRKGKKIFLNEYGQTAAEYAVRILAMEQDLEVRIRMMEREKHTFSFGAVSPGPILELFPILSDCIQGRTIMSEMRDTSELLTGLLSGAYQLIFLDKPADDPRLYCREVCDERLYYCFYAAENDSIPESVCFEDIDGFTLMMPSQIGFWDKIVRAKMPHSSFIIQDGDAMVNYLSEHSTLPAFSSDIGIRRGSERPNRISVPITDDEAWSAFWAVCKKDNREVSRIIDVLEKTYRE